METEFEELFTQRIMQKVVSDYGDINMMKLAQYAGTTNTGLRLAFNSQRKWNAELWLTILTALGAVEIGKNKIIIHTKNIPGLKDLKTLSKIDYGERRRCYVP